MESLTVAKVISMFCLGLITWLVGLIPLIGVRKGWMKSSESDQSQTVLTIFSCMMSFGGGVILTSCLTHMLPDVNDLLSEMREDPNNTSVLAASELPVAEIFVLAGFILIYLVEELGHWALVRTGHISASGEGHGHSHGDVTMPVEESIQATARGFLVVLALSIHDFFEGIALGVSKRTTGVYFLLLAFASHKWVISGTMGLNWARSAIKPLVAMIYMTVFCGISPVGVAVGMALKEANEEHGSDTLVVFQGLATGSLLYVVFFEILEKERQKNVVGILQASCLALGFIFMVILGLAEVASENDEKSTNLSPLAFETSENFAT